MNQEKFEEWCLKNAKNIRNKYINKIDYVWVTMTDDWIAIFEKEQDSFYRPLIQAKTEAHAQNYCSLREPVLPGVHFI